MLEGSIPMRNIVCMGSSAVVEDLKPVIIEGAPSAQRRQTIGNGEIDITNSEIEVKLA